MNRTSLQERILAVLPDIMTSSGFGNDVIVEVCASFELLNVAGAFKLTTSRFDIIQNRRVDAAIVEAVDRVLQS